MSDGVDLFCKAGKKGIKPSEVPLQAIRECFFPRLDINESLKKSKDGVDKFNCSYHFFIQFYPAASLNQACCF